MFITFDDVDQSELFILAPAGFEKFVEGEAAGNCKHTERREKEDAFTHLRIELLDKSARRLKVDVL